MNRLLPTNAARKVNNALPTALANMANTTANGALNAVNAVVNNTTNTFKNVANEAGAVMENAPAAMNDALFGVPEKIGNAVSNAATGLTNAANKMTIYVSNAANNAMKSVGINNAASGNANGNKRNNGNNGNGSGNNGSKANNTGFFNSIKNSITGNSAVNSLMGNTNTGSNTGEAGFFGSLWFFLLIIVLAFIGVFVFFFDQIMDFLPPSIRDGFNRLRAAIGLAPEPEPAPEPPAPEPEPPAIIPGEPTPAYLPDSGAEQRGDEQRGDEQRGDEQNGDGNGNGQPPSGVQTLVKDIESIVDKQLPQQKKKEVFNIKENRYKYEDAEPLCNALGAELATYEQVKEAYERGADWCNYGWVKGQRAVYPTQPGTYEKMQKGPKEQRQACGKPGINGGYFDNPDLRFGVT